MREILRRGISQFGMRSLKNPDKLIVLATFSESRVRFLPNLVVLAAIKFLMKMVNRPIG